MSGTSRKHGSEHTLPSTVQKPLRTGKTHRLIRASDVFDDGVKQYQTQEKLKQFSMSHQAVHIGKYILETGFKRENENEACFKNTEYLPLD